MLNVKLKQYTWDELMTPFGDAKPITDEEFTALMALSFPSVMAQLQLLNMK